MQKLKNTFDEMAWDKEEKRVKPCLSERAEGALGMISSLQGWVHSYPLLIRAPALPCANCCVPFVSRFAPLG
jgi:hypothetical protein